MSLKDPVMFGSGRPTCCRTFRCTWTCSRETWLRSTRAWRRWRPGYHW